MRGNVEFLAFFFFICLVVVVFASASNFKCEVYVIGYFVGVVEILSIALLV